MRYEIQKSPIIGKFYIWDNVEKKPTTKMIYDIIVDIISDKYAIVGKEDSYVNGCHIYRTYWYGIIDINGRTVVDMDYEYIYPTDSVIYCKGKNLPVNKLTYLDKFLWHHKKGLYLSEYPIFFCNTEQAIIRCENFCDFCYSGYVYKLIDYAGKVLKEEKIEVKDYRDVLSRFFNTYVDIDYSKLVYIEVLAVNANAKWQKLNEITKRTNDKYYNLCSIKINDNLILHNVHLGFAWNKFIIIYKDAKDANNIPYDYQRNIIRDNEICYAILNDTFQLLYYSKDGFKVNKSVFYDKIVIGEEYIMDYNGALCNIPKHIRFENIRCDRLGYLQISIKDRLGYMNDKGEIVIPPIFPKDVEIGIDEDIAQAEWEERQREIVDSISDAFEGDQDAYWNID